MTKPDLLPGIQVLERGWLSANNILFTDGPETVMIDSGYCTHAPQTLSLVETTLGGRPLDLLLNTHLHSDHCGGNAALQARYPDVRTWIPPGQASQVTQWDPAALTYVPTGQLCPQFKFSGTLQAGSTLRFGAHDWQVHAAAGHDPHSFVFFEPENGILISADALWENGFGVVFPELEGTDAFAEVAATLDMIDSLKPKTVIPGHGPIFAYSPEILGRARQRLDYFAKNPRKHAHHAVKVLLKFKLLETQRQSMEDLIDWADATPYFLQIRKIFFPELSIRSWIETLCAELVAAGVARTEASYILNA
ncbi:MBL fold metallo-hydrolase [Polaromonas sp.]|uniref:MBL fold metallo-hydrolase n=1 Tax=Polaromonas sp. TaxID=1869339 RepID=UPI001D42A800|nr:MBL fold metallo-hydrolase [Polaromonas sp.]MBT9476945.1 MBL fold metallo-hydrolase [Polaromonas sp.]